MQIKDQFLIDLKKQLKDDETKYTALLDQTRGALFVLDHLEANQERDAMSIPEFEEMVGGKVEAIEPVNQDG